MYMHISYVCTYTHISLSLSLSLSLVFLFSLSLFACVRVFDRKSLQLNMCIST